MCRSNGPETRRPRLNRAGPREYSLIPASGCAVKHSKSDAIRIARGVVARCTGRDAVSGEVLDTTPHAIAGEVEVHADIRVKRRLVIEVARSIDRLEVPDRVG